MLASLVKPGLTGGWREITDLFENKSQSLRIHDCLVKTDGFTGKFRAFYIEIGRTNGGESSAPQASFFFFFLHGDQGLKRRRIV